MAKISEVDRENRDTVYFDLQASYLVWVVVVWEKVKGVVEKISIQEIRKVKDILHD